MVHRLLARAVVLRPQETAALLLGFTAFLSLLCAYYLLRPLRDAMGLVGGVGQLPWLFSATFVSMLALVPVFGALTARLPPRRFVPLVYRFFALNILGFGALFATGVQEVAVSRVFFVWLSVFNLFVISVFWSVMADGFSSEQGKRLFGFIAAGGTAGALLGPALAAVLAVRFGVALLALIAALLLEVAVQCLRRLQHAESHGGKDGPPAGERLGGGILAGVTLIARDRYLLGIVVYLLLHSCASTLLYFEQGRIVAAGFADTASRTRFFALVDLCVSGLALSLQLFGSAYVIRRAGVGVALAVLPLATLAAFGALAAWPTVAVLGAVQVLRRSLDYALARPARETLFTVVALGAKYKAKNVIDTVVYRGGDAVSGWLSAALTALGLGFAGMGAAFAPAAVLWVGLSAWLSRRQARYAEESTTQRKEDHEPRIE
ncbi:NTP/NDP exchange transporter [Noviherbaspirillum aridicola]|uniref:NTP/NDP exchange transporter n=1 Tax=Noviherbaspirillum aridicola TaxID=2849687 RepID=UPI001C8097C2|nr:MFS transporter [Noviherbaspirillum aridicola]